MHNLQTRYGGASWIHKARRAHTPTGRNLDKRQHRKREILSYFSRKQKHLRLRSRGQWEGTEQPPPRGGGFCPLEHPAPALLWGQRGTRSGSPSPAPSEWLCICHLSQTLLLQNCHLCRQRYGRATNPPRPLSLQEVLKKATREIRF